MEAKDSALLSSRDTGLLEPTEWLKGSKTSSGVWKDPGLTLPSEPAVWGPHPWLRQETPANGLQASLPRAWPDPRALPAQLWPAHPAGQLQLRGLGPGQGPHAQEPQFPGLNPEARTH